MTNFIQEQYGKFRLNSRLVDVIPIGHFNTRNEALEASIELIDIKNEYDEAMEKQIKETQDKIRLVKGKYISRK